MTSDELRDSLNCRFCNIPRDLHNVRHIFEPKWRVGEGVVWQTALVLPGSDAPEKVRFQGVVRDVDADGNVLVAFSNFSRRIAFKQSDPDLGRVMRAAAPSP